MSEEKIVEDYNTEMRLLEPIIKAADELMKGTCYLPNPIQIRHLLDNMSKYDNYVYAYEVFYQWVGQCEKVKKLMKIILENLEPLKNEQYESLTKEYETTVPSDLVCFHCGADYTKLMRVIDQNSETWKQEVIIHCNNCGKTLDKVTE